MIDTNTPSGLEQHYEFQHASILQTHLESLFHDFKFDPERKSIYWEDGNSGFELAVYPAMRLVSEKGFPILMTEAEIKANILDDNFFYRAYIGDFLAEPTLRIEFQWSHDAAGRTARADLVPEAERAANTFDPIITQACADAFHTPITHSAIAMTESRKKELLKQGYTEDLTVHIPSHYLYASNLGAYTKVYMPNDDK